MLFCELYIDIINNYYSFTERNHLFLKMTERVFVTQEDINELENNGIDTKTAISTLINELCSYFNKVWHEDFRIKDNIKSLEELNQKHLCNYPSSPGHYLIDDSFTGVDCPIEILSDTSKILLNYFYGIQFHY